MCPPGRGEKSSRGRTTICVTVGDDQALDGTDQGASAVASLALAADMLLVRWTLGLNRPAPAQAHGIAGRGYTHDGGGETGSAAPESAVGGQWLGAARHRRTASDMSSDNEARPWRAKREYGVPLPNKMSSAARRVLCIAERRGLSGRR